MSRFSSVLVAFTLLLALAGCDQLGIEAASAVAARKEADGKAIGSACRHAGRAIEDCYTLNKKADRSAMFAGWREMNEYMRENKIEPVAPVLSGGATALAKDAEGADGNDSHAKTGPDKPVTKGKKLAS